MKNDDIGLNPDASDSGWSCDENGNFGYYKNGVRTFFDLTSTDGVRKEPSPPVVHPPRKEDGSGEVKLKHRRKVDARRIQQADHFTRGRHRRRQSNDWGLTWIFVGIVLTAQAVITALASTWTPRSQADIDCVCAIIAVLFGLAIFSRHADPKQWPRVMRGVVLTALIALGIATFGILP
jgi:heme/copper-type cytochrome/quinol oxidase subunit 4